MILNRIQKLYKNLHSSIFRILYCMNLAIVELDMYSGVKCLSERNRIEAAVSHVNVAITFLESYISASRVLFHRLIL